MPKRARLLLITSILLGAAWMTLAVFVAPRMIRDAYAGRSMPFLNAVIQGRAAFPVEHYLLAWRRIALQLTLGSLLAAGLGLLAWRYREPLSRRIAQALRSPPLIGTAEATMLGAWLGFAAGLIEGVAVLLQVAITGNPGDPPAPLFLWMAPLATALLGAGAGFMLGLLGVAWRGLPLWIPAALFTTLGFYAILHSLELRLRHDAALLLSIGVGVHLAGVIQRRGAGFPRMVRRTLPLLAALPFVIGGGQLGLSRFREHRAQAGLGPSEAGAPNVLLLILDTVRAPELSLYGYTRSTSPEIDRWASGGVTFDAAVAPASWTLPTHASLFTGKLPHELAVDWDRRLDGAAPTLAERLQSRGYATAGFIGNLWNCARASGLDRGFAVYQDFPISWGTFLKSSYWTERLTNAVRERFGPHGKLGFKTAEDINREFLKWRPPVGRPFFAFLNYIDAHDTYETHPPFDVRFAKRPPRYWLYKPLDRDYTREEMQEFIDAYDSAIAYLDHQVGVLLAELERRGVLENTILIITADHGEQFGEHNLTTHGNSLYMPVLHVPLVIRYPRGVPAGRRVAEPVSLRDIAATVLDLSETSAETLPGQSLARHWSTDSAALHSFPEGLGVLSELTYVRRLEERGPIRRGSMKSIVRGNLHYIRNGDGVEELYDLLDDPAEARDLAASHQATLADFRRALGSLAPSAASSRSADRSRVDGIPELRGSRPPAGRR